MASSLLLMVLLVFCDDGIVSKYIIKGLGFFDNLFCQLCTDILASKSFYLWRTLDTNHKSCSYGSSYMYLTEDLIHILTTLNTTAPATHFSSVSSNTTPSDLIASSLEQPLRADPREHHQGKQ